MLRRMTVGAVVAVLALGPAIDVASAAQGKPAKAVKPAKTTPGPKPGAGPKPKTTATTGAPKANAAPKATPPGLAKKAAVAAVAPVTPPTTPVVLVPAPVPKNPKLVARLQSMLPAGLTVAQAATGFKNQGQFVAAVNVSRNLGIPFVDLKARMVGQGLSLGQSIQALRPSVDGPREAMRAQRQAARDLN
jgi:hypothetical protein